MSRAPEQRKRLQCEERGRGDRRKLSKPAGGSRKRGAPPSSASSSSVEAGSRDAKANKSEPWRQGGEHNPVGKGKNKKGHRGISHIRRTYTRCMCGNSERTKEASRSQGCFSEEGPARPEG